MLPYNITDAGKYVKIPKGPLDKNQTKSLLVTVVTSDRKNANAVNSCIDYHNKLRLLYDVKQ